MTKKNSLLTFVFAICMLVSSVFMLTACGGNKNDPAKNDPEKTETIKTEAVIALDNAYVLTKTYDGQTAENPSATQITKNSDGAMTIEWYAGEIKLEDGPKDAGSYKLVISTAETETYNAGKLEKEYTINKKQLTISGTTVADKEYDGNNTAVVSAGTLDGLVESDEVSVGVTATGTFASKDVAYEYDVDPQDVTISYALTGDLAKNYLAPVGETQQATINPKTLSNVNLTKTYDGHGRFERTALTTAQGIVEGESIKIYVEAINKNVGVYKEGNEDENFEFNEYYVLYIGDIEEQTVNYAWGDTCTATITPLKLTITGTTVNNKTYDGTTNGTVKQLGDTNTIVGDDLTIVPTVKFADKNVVTYAKNCTISYSISGEDADNYIAPDNDTSTAWIYALNFYNANTGHSDVDMIINAQYVNNSGTVTFQNVEIISGILDGDIITATIEKQGTGSTSFPCNHFAAPTNMNTTSFKLAFSGADAGNYQFFDVDSDNNYYFNMNVYLNLYEQEVKVDTETQFGTFASSICCVKVDLTAVTGENGYSLVPKTEGTIETSGSNAPVMYDEEGNVVENMKPTKDGTYFIKFHANNANPYITVASPKA